MKNTPLFATGMVLSSLLTELVSAEINHLDPRGWGGGGKPTTKATSATATITHAATQTITQAARQKKSIGTAIIAITVVVSIIALILIAIGCFCLLRRLRKKREGASSLDN
ncbi:hypothetical protein QBC44DRAFT_363674 [Cladorrhinum sp. PSN332]|nr:hypothetical protein QBC44DRAFT_363674 [Cladorrhinum sp. PSN332]